MHLGGMLDGQARFSKMAIAAQEAAAFAYQSDPMCVATITQAQEYFVLDICPLIRSS